MALDEDQPPRTFFAGGVAVPVVHVKQASHVDVHGFLDELFRGLGNLRGMYKVRGDGLTNKLWFLVLPRRTLGTAMGFPTTTVTRRGRGMGKNQRPYGKCGTANPMRFKNHSCTAGMRMLSMMSISPKERIGTSSAPSVNAMRMKPLCLVMTTMSSASDSLCNISTCPPGTTMHDRSACGERERERGERDCGERERMR